MLTTGLDGGSSTQSASAIASSTPGAGDAASAPANDDLGGRDRGVQPDPPLLEVHGLPARRPSARSVTWVSTRSSVIGSSVTPGCQRSHSRG